VKVVLAGGTGFLGGSIASALVSKGHEAVALTRGPDAPGSPARRVHWDADGSASGTWVREIEGAQAVVNLTGAGMADRRWTTRRKQELRDSRVLPTRSLVSAIRMAAARPSVFVQGSAVGYYGMSADVTFDESFPPGDDFLGQLAVAWEAEAHPVTALGCRLVFIRSGVVLARDAGALPQLRRPFLFFVGGRIASGEQAFSWIHVDDWAALVVWAIENPTLHGVVNATSPEPVTNAEFARALGKAVHRPSWFPVPAFVLRLLFGQMADEMLIHGQRVVPKRALEHGFVFRHPEVNGALQQL
jgi:uncharacterized protein (TIGR01777 family)